MEANAQGLPAFLFNVTMQNHSGYSQGWKNLERAIQVGSGQRIADPSAEQYLDLVLESDKALEQLIGHYSQAEERTMIVFFGDHQPPLKTHFMRSCMASLWRTGPPRRFCSSMPSPSSSGPTTRWRPGKM